MAGTSTNISIPMDTDLKERAESLFDTTLNVANERTVSAMLEAERISKDPSVKGYDNLDELFADLKR